MNSTLNTSGIDAEWNGTSLNPLYDISFPILTVVVVVSNGLVVWSSGLILKKGNQVKKSTYLFLGNLSLTVIIIAIIKQIIFWYELKDTHFSLYVCKVLSGLNSATLIANMYSFGLIAIDRYIFILHGMKYEQWVYPNIVKWSIVGTWIIGILAGLLPFFTWNKPRKNNLKICLMSVFATKPYVLFSVIFSLIPVLIVIIAYSAILFKALWKIKQVTIKLKSSSTQSGKLRVHVGSISSINRKTSDTNFSQSTSVYTKKKWRAIKMILLTTLTLILTWVPFLIVWCIWIFICDDNIKESEQPKLCPVYTTTLRPTFFTLNLIHDLSLPVIYVWWVRGFKNFWVSRCKRPK